MKKFSHALVLFLICEPAFSQFTFNDLKTLIQNNKLQTVEKVVPQLPEDLRSNFTLMHKTKSLQEANEHFPRAILFGMDAKSILAFNGDASQRNYDTIEMMQFNDSTSSFELHQIKFPADSGQTGEVQFSEKNPAKCLACHRQNPSPNWGGYSFWEGAYGQGDDYVEEYGNPNDFGNPITREDADRWHLFQRSGLGQGRYKYLRPIAESENSPYLPNNAFKGPVRFRPNLRLLSLSAALNRRKIVKQMAGNTNWKKIRVLYVMLGLSCKIHNSGNLGPVVPLVRELFPDSADLPLEVSPYRGYKYVVNINDSKTSWWDLSYIVLRGAGVKSYDTSSEFPFVSTYGGNNLGTRSQFPEVLSASIFQNMQETEGFQYSPYNYFQEGFKDPNDQPFLSIMDSLIGDFSREKKDIAGLCEKFEKEL